MRQQAFFCPQHRIFITPSTWEYDDERENLLWADHNELELLNAIKKVKRESRLARDNSEDALSWNVFRFCERTDTLSRFLSDVLAAPVDNPTLSYWSCSSATKSVCEALARARTEFGEQLERSSEPDLVIEADGKMIWIEAKLGSTNDTTPSNPNDTKGYLAGGNAWFEKVFTSEYRTVAIEAQRYELVRLFLLGTWAAKQSGSEFCLINITKESSREQSFVNHVRKVPGTKFVTASWEEFYRWADNKLADEPLTERVLGYLRDKSAGYIGGRLQPAFPTVAASPKQ